MSQNKEVCINYHAITGSLFFYFLLPKMKFRDILKVMVRIRVIAESMVQMGGRKV